MQMNKIFFFSPKLFSLKWVRSIYSVNQSKGRKNLLSTPSKLFDALFTYLFLCVVMWGWDWRQLQGEEWNCLWPLLVTLWPGLWELKKKKKSIWYHLSTRWGLDKMADILQRIFSKAFSWKLLYLLEDVLKSVPLSTLEVSTGSGNGLVPIRHQAITWTNVDQDYWHHMASLAHNELMLWFACLTHYFVWLSAPVGKSWCDNRHKVR